MQRSSFPLHDGWKCAYACCHLYPLFPQSEATGKATFDVLELYQLGLPVGTQYWLFGAFALAFAIKVPMFPFHTWLPDAHVEAPTAGSVVLAGVLLKMGSYGILRISYPLLPDMALWFAPYVALFGLISIVYGALCAMAQKDFKKLVAYSSVSHMGYVMLGLAAFSTTAIDGAALQMFNHGLSSAMLFLIVGVIYDRAHHRDLDRFGGIGVQMPWYTGIATVGFFASLGLPGRTKKGDEECRKDNCRWNEIPSHGSSSFA
jgi:NADH-quinone oxidoreductase subunit M